VAPQDTQLAPRNKRSHGINHLMADVHLPPTLTPLFAGLPRRVAIDAATVADAIDRLDEQWPGIRDRLLESRRTIRPHIHVYVDKERAELGTAVDPRSRVDVIAAISGG
jgi:molybdopterin converting factor small subunit